jgi:MSHA biogenesis protein MshG
MPLYSYLARDKQGRPVKGEIALDNEGELVRYLEREGLLPIKFEKKVEEKVTKFTLAALIPKRIKKQTLIIFTRQFASTIKAGIPLVNALRFLAEETEDKLFKKILASVVMDVEQGLSLSVALRKYPETFPELYVEMVASGEASGTLDKVMENLAQTMERDYRLYLEIKNALRYPALVIIAIIVAIFVITLFVIPKFARVYSQFKMPLPLPTRILIAVSNFLLHNIFILMFIALALIVGFNYWKRTPKGKIVWGKMKLKIPILGDIFMKVSLLRFCFIFNALNSVGLPILKSLEIVSKTLGNEFLKQRADVFKQGVSEGKSLSAMISQDRYFPKLLANMIGVGEQSGSMDVVLESLSEFYNTEVRSKLDTLTVTLEPMLTAFLAVCVFILALGVFLPMWNMTQIFKLGG